MKRIIMLLIGLLSLSSCKSYMVSTVASKNTIQSPETGKFNMTSDSLVISYSFSGPNMPLNVEVFNKLNEPLFVDWERSALVIGETAYSFVDDKVHLSADVSTYNNVLLEESRYYYSDVKGTAQTSKKQSFIPPNSKITKSIYALSNLNNVRLLKSAFKKVPMDSDVSVDPIKVAISSFDEDNSPFQFKCFITVFTLKDNLPKTAAYQHEFYISSIAKTSIDPSKIIMFKNQKDATLVNGKYTGFAKTLMTVGVIGLAGAAGVASSELANQNAEN